jgi:exodeoxyribonuclease VII small subunit
MAKAASLEENFASIENILEKLDQGSLSLEESFRLYKDGIKLVKQCNIQLDKVEKQLMILDREKEDEDGVSGEI